MKVDQYLKNIEQGHMLVFTQSPGDNIRLVVDGAGNARSLEKTEEFNNLAHDMAPKAVAGSRAFMAMLAEGNRPLLIAVAVYPGSNGPPTLYDRATGPIAGQWLENDTFLLPLRTAADAVQERPEKKPDDGGGKGNSSP